MVHPDSVLVTLPKQVDRLPEPQEPVRAPRGRPKVYEDRLFLNALLVMIVRHYCNVHEFSMAVQHPTKEMLEVQTLLRVKGHFPSRRTWERRLHAIAARLPDPIGCLGRYLVEQMGWGQTTGRAVADDSTVVPASGSVWHKKQREEGNIPVGSRDTEAPWTKSGWQGWVEGWNLHVAAAVADIWVPLAAELRAANGAHSQVAPWLVKQGPTPTRFVLGDKHSNREPLRQACWHKECQ
jgi:hypothetical protein